MKIVCLPIVLLSFALSFVGCDHDKNASAAGASTQAPTTPPDATAPKLSLPPDTGPPPAIDSTRAFQYVKEIVANGPRPIGSANHRKVEDYILAHLKGDVYKRQSYDCDLCLRTRKDQRD